MMNLLTWVCSILTGYILLFAILIVIAIFLTPIFPAKEYDPEPLNKSLEELKAIVMKIPEYILKHIIR